MSPQERDDEIRGVAPVPTFAPLGVSEYRRVWAASMVSHVGTFLQLTAAPWLMNELTRSPFMVSLVTTALTLPRLLLTLPAGVLADAIDRRTLMMVGQVVSAISVAAMAVLTVTDVITPASLLALSFSLGVGAAISLPSFQTLIPDLVPPNLRAQAITLNSAAFNVARAVGPALGGALVAAGLTGLAFGANAASYLGLVGVLLGFPRQTVEDPTRQTMWRSAALGMRYVRFTRPIRVLLAVAGVFALTTACVQALLPVVSDELGLGATGFGILYGAFGAGALGGALTRERARAHIGAAMLPGSVTVFGVAGIVFGLAPWPVLAAAALAVSGTAWVWTLTTLNASIQILAPRWIRGRVVSLYILAIGLQPVGAFLAGAIAEATGGGPAVAILTAFTVALGAWSFRLHLPVLGELEEPLPPEDFVFPRHAARVAGTPIVVVNTWVIDPDDAEEFFAAMRALRRQRFRTGAHRWSLYRDADRPYRITEFFTVHDWDEHLAQHARMDVEASRVLARARSFDRDDGPVTRHLAGLDIVDPEAPAILDQMLTVHEELHRTDGSVPLGDRDADGRDGDGRDGDGRDADGRDAVTGRDGDGRDADGRDADGRDAVTGRGPLGDRAPRLP